MDGVLLQSNYTAMWATSLWPMTGMWVRTHGTKRWKRTHDRHQSLARLRWLVECGHEIDLDHLPTWEERQAWRALPEDVVAFLVAGCSDEVVWAGLELLSRFPVARDLAKGVPLLAVVLATRCRFRRNRSRWYEIAELLAPLPGMAGWRELARALGLDSSRAFVELLRRMPLEPGSYWGMRYGLEIVWAHPLARKRLLHTRSPSLNAVSVLHAAVNLGCVDVLHPSLLDHEDLRAGRTTLPTYLRRGVPAWVELHPRRRVPMLRSPDDVYALVERVRGESRVRYGLPAVDETARLRALPPPPLPAAPGIRPLTTGEQLDAEGHAMGHCLGNGTWERASRARLGYGYAVELNGERASLWLERNEDRPGDFCIGEFKGPRNRAPSTAAATLVTAWLAQHLRAIAGGALTLPEEWTRPPFSEDSTRFEGIPQPLRWAFGDEDTLPF
jgi:hypothetical protein